jgi:putative regulator of septum formation
MRRWLAGVLGVVLLSGCAAGLPDGVDGDLTGGWALPPQAVQWRPLPSQCFDELVDTVGPGTYAPLNCAQGHLAETYWIGDLNGPAASPAGTAAGARTAAYVECSREADEFLGGPWRASRVVIHVVLPDGAGWAAGARWFRCDIGELNDRGDVAGRAGSLSNALAGSADLRLACFDPTVSGDSVQRMRVVDCARPHHAEFAGLWTAPPMTRDALESSPEFARGCLSTIARFTAVPDDGMVKYRTGWLGFPGSEAAWDAGDRTVQCYLWLAGETLTGSSRNAGPGKLKVHYA